ncbi:MAG TPA: FAD-dependent monooxygenase [Sphingomonas sp.]|nr:FAD-dependent monooxygenase [Sphingomonas sp.]
MRRTSPLIVGGGPAGSAAAITLAQNGVRAELVERTTQPHDPVCGGFLGWDAIRTLERVGIDPWAIGARAISHVRIIAGKAQAEAPLPHRAAGLSRRTLDIALLGEAARLGVSVRRGVTVRRIDETGVRFADGASCNPESLFLATGKYELRGAQRGAGGRARVGLRTTLPADPDLDGWIELHLLDGGYAGLLTQDDGRINLCLSVAERWLAGAGGSPDRLLTRLADEAPRLAERLSGETGAWSAIAAVPYGWRARGTISGRFRIGDQAAVIASLAGDGIAIALASGRAASLAWLEGGSGAATGFQRHFARRAAVPIRAGEALRALAERPSLARRLVPLLAAIPGSYGIAALLTRIEP